MQKNGLVARVVDEIKNIQADLQDTDRRLGDLVKVIEDQKPEEPKDRAQLLAEFLRNRGSQA